LEDEIRQNVRELGFLLSKISSSASSSQLGQPQQRAAVQQQADMTLQPLMDFLDGRSAAPTSRFILPAPRRMPAPRDYVLLAFITFYFIIF